MSEAWNIAAAVIVSLGGSGAIILGLSSFLGKVWAERILANEKNQLDIIKMKEEITFSKLHYEQAIVIKDIYRKLLDIQRSCRLIVKYFEHKNKLQDELNDELKEQGLSDFSVDLRKYFEENEIFLPDKVSGLIIQILDSDGMIWFHAFTEFGDKDKSALLIIKGLLTKVETAMLFLKKEFRLILGVN